MRNPEAGAALVVTLMLTAMLAFLGGALVFIIDVETTISANHRVAQQVLDAAESGIECAIAELGRLPDWSAVPAGASAPSLNCLAAAALARTPDGRPLDIPEITALVQTGSDARYGSPADNPDSPTWILWARGPLTAAPGRIHPFVLVWVADDGDDGDGQPQQDSNGVLILRAQAFGGRGARAGIDALVSRVPDEGPQPSSVRLVAWREGR